jgi:hypothetical protein
VVNLLSQASHNFINRRTTASLAATARRLKDRLDSIKVVHKGYFLISEEAMFNLRSRLLSCKDTEARVA